MSTEDYPPSATRVGKVRWRRFALVMIPAFAVSAILVGLTATGSIAASISVSGTAFEVTASQFSGTGFEQYGGVVAGTNGAQHPVAITALRSGTIANLCQSVKVGPFTLVLRAGGGGTPSSVSNIVIDADQQSGNAAFHNVTIGQDASTLTEDPGQTGPAGGFAEQADSFSISNLRQHTWLTTAGTFTLPGLSLSFSRSGCLPWLRIRRPVAVARSVRAAHAASSCGIGRHTMLPGSGPNLAPGCGRAGRRSAGIAGIRPAAS